MLTATLLRKAANHLKQSGMVAGVRHDDETGKMCVLGALGTVVFNDPWADLPKEDEQQLVDILGLTFVRDRYNGTYGGGDSTDILAAWSNNAVDAGTPEVIIDGLRRAARKLK